MFNDEQVKKLDAKLDGAHVKTREQAGRKLSYVEGWFAIAEANRIFGFGCWDRETVELRQLFEPYQDTKNLWRVGYMARVRVTVYANDRKRVVREGCGYGSGVARDLGDAHESAIKESETDSMKRALMTFGNPFGLALYDKQQAEVERNSAGSSNGRTPPFEGGNAGSSPAPATKPRTTKEWIEDAKATIRAAKSQAEIKAWETANEAKLDWLQEKHPGARLDLGNLMAARWQALEAANVG